MMLRMLFIYRAIVNYSIFSNVYAKKLCTRYGFHPSYNFTFRCYMEINPMATIGIILLNNCLILSWILRIFERPYYRLVGKDDANYRQFDSFFSANYMMLITMTTVGYGDLTATTWMGRLLIIVAALSSSFVMAIFIGSITNQFLLSVDQQLALRHILITKSAALTISKSIRFFMSKKKYYYSLLEKGKIDSKRSYFL